MPNIAIITARGGSKRIPRKNIKDFLGKPIIAYSIEAAIESKLFDEVMVSTDDSEIAEIAVKYGAKIPFFRSSETSDDFATTHDVIQEVLLTYKDLGQNFDFACCIYPTAPFVNPKLLKNAFNILKENSNYDFVMPIVSFSFPIQRSFILEEDHKIKYAFPENINKRSQDLRKHFHDTGQFYMFDVKKYFERGSLVSSNMYGIEVSELAVQDIDNEVDWKLAELKYSLMLKDHNTKDEY